MKKSQKYTILIGAIGVIIAFWAYQLSVQSTQASIDFWLSDFNQERLRKIYKYLEYVADFHHKSADKYVANLHPKSAKKEDQNSI